MQSLFANSIKKKNEKMKKSEKSSFKFLNKNPISFIPNKGFFSSFENEFSQSLIQQTSGHPWAFGFYGHPHFLPQQNYFNFYPYRLNQFSNYSPSTVNLGNYSNTNIINNFSPVHNFPVKNKKIKTPPKSKPNIKLVNESQHLCETNKKIPPEENNFYEFKRKKEYKNLKKIKSTTRSDNKRNFLRKRNSFDDSSRSPSNLIDKKKRPKSYYLNLIDLTERKVLSNMSNKIRQYWKGFNNTYPFAFKQNKLIKNDVNDSQEFVVEKVQYNFKKVNPNLYEREIIES
jgi:hypothetical protein